jgi:hypothetical protein
MHENIAGQVDGHAQKEYQQDEEQFPVGNKASRGHSDQCKEQVASTDIQLRE